MRLHRRDPRTIALGLVGAAGYSVTAVFLYTGFTNGQWGFPGGDVISYYSASGDALRAGREVYFPGFLYGPPWAVAFAAFSWLGPGVIHALILVLDAVALWAIAGGDWRRLGYLLWFPLIAFEIAAGQLNLLIAAAIVVGQRRQAIWPLAIMTLAKVWPVVGLTVSRWRTFILWLVVFSLPTLPWLHLWPEWFGTLIRTSSQPLGPVIPVPFLIRAVAAALLLVLRRPWATALAAAISSPGLYWGQLVVLVAPAALWLESRTVPRGSPLPAPLAATE